MRVFKTSYFLSAASVSLAAMMGSSAQAALVISTDATQNVTCSDGVCSATAANAVLNVGDVTALLASAPLTIQSGSQAQDIQVEAPFIWSSSNALTLDSYRAITVDKPVADAGPAAFNITTNHGGSGGEFLFRNKSRISFSGINNDLGINGHSYKLFDDIKSLSSAISNGYGFYALANNYDAANDGIYQQSPISSSLQGMFNGLGNTISRLKIRQKSSSQPAALFAGNSGQISSLRIVQADISATHGRYAVAVAVAYNNGNIDGLHASGKISVHATRKGVNVGGLVGYTLGGIIINSSADVSIKVSGTQSSGDNGIGGLVGDESAGGIE